MAVPTSGVHVYNGTVTSGGKDGDMVTESAVGGNRILLALHRGETSDAIQLAVRATVTACYIVQIASRNSKILLSLDSIHWTGKVVLITVETVNSLFYVKAVADDNEDYGDTVWNLEVDFYAPV